MNASERVTSTDLYPTSAWLAGAKSPHEAFFYHGNFGELAAVRAGPWKLHLNPTPVLYNLEEDIGEQNDVSRGRFEVVQQLRQTVIAVHEEMRRAARPAGEMGPTP